jgi:hypothetical protein
VFLKCPSIQKYFWYTAVGFLLAGSFPISISRADIQDPFTDRERLLFDISWYGVSGGTAVMQVKETYYGEQPAYHITSTAKSNSFISVFYPVNDYVESFVDRDRFVPFRMRSKLKEGNYRADREIIFDWENSHATFINYRKDDRKVSPIDGPLTQDPLSVLYYFRTHPLEIGKTVEMDVFDGNKTWKLGVQVLGKEQITTPAGTFTTFKTKATVRHKGVFVNKGDVVVWFTDDERRIPVLMESKIKIGSITATLLDITRE